MDKTHKGLSALQLTMMALGTVIGGSFFLGSSVAIRAAGPSVIITYIIGGILVYYIFFALSEMTVAKPDAGSFRTYAAMAFGPGAPCPVKPRLSLFCCVNGYPIFLFHGLAALLLQE